MRENINVPVYRVELAKTDRSSCFTAGPPQKRASGAAGKCRFGLGELCHPVITHATAASNVAVIGDGAEGPAPKKKRGRPTKPKPDGLKLTGKAYVDWAVKIPVNSVRVGSVDPVAGTYGRWSHAECWRVPGKVHRGLPNPALEPDPVAFERALLAMNEVVFCGFEELSLEHRAIVVARVMDVSRGRRRRRRLESRPSPGPTSSPRTGVGPAAAARAGPGQTDGGGRGGTGERGGADGEEAREGHVRGG